MFTLFTVPDLSWSAQPPVPVDDEWSGISKNLYMPRTCFHSHIQSHRLTKSCCCVPKKAHLQIHRVIGTLHQRSGGTMLSNSPWAHYRWSRRSQKWHRSVLEVTQVSSLCSCRPVETLNFYLSELITRRNQNQFLIWVEDPESVSTF